MFKVNTCNIKPGAFQVTARCKYWMWLQNYLEGQNPDLQWWLTNNIQGDGGGGHRSYLESLSYWYLTLKEHDEHHPWATKTADLHEIFHTSSGGHSQLPTRVRTISTWNSPIEPPRTCLGDLRGSQGRDEHWPGAVPEATQSAPAQLPAAPFWSLGSVPTSVLGVTHSSLLNPHSKPMK